MDINVTEKAMEELAKVAKTRDQMKALRLYVAAYGWGGPTFGLALDEYKDGDSKVEIEEFTFVVEEALAEEYSNWEIDYSDNWMKKGFSVAPTGYAGGRC